MFLRKFIFFMILLLFPAQLLTKPRIYISFLWHYHQPIYYPYQNIIDTYQKGIFGFDLLQIFLDRQGDYTEFPIDAVKQIVDNNIEHGGIQISFTGSLLENLDNIEQKGYGFSNWKKQWLDVVFLKTVLGNSVVDFVHSGYHHPLMPLIHAPDMSLQIKAHYERLKMDFGNNFPSSHGMFPPETAFTESMIPILKKNNIDWVIVDNIHIDRAHIDYPYTPASNLYPPNKADQVNSATTNWVQLNGIWAPSKVSAPWGYQPHYAQYIDPTTGNIDKIIVVPAARYEGNEDGKGGFGALQYEAVMSQYEQDNTDDAHPMLILLHHDGDNYGGGMSVYYKENFANFISWLKSNPDRFALTTVQDYLDQFPPDSDDIAHVEPGSWAGADNGDPEFLKWNGAPNDAGYSPDRNSWGIVTATQNRVLTAQANQKINLISNIINGTGNDIEKAWHFFLNSETSCYWYWDFSENGLWDSNPARACNQAVQFADNLLQTDFIDTVPPTIYMPQRKPYNPGGIEWKQEPESSDFFVWSYVYDVSGLDSVKLLYRTSSEQQIKSIIIKEYGNESEWTSIDMIGASEQSKTVPQPKYKAFLYKTEIKKLKNVFVNYYILAKDSVGNIAKSPIIHAYIGNENSINPNQTNQWVPEFPTKNDIITIFSNKPGKLHWGINGWTQPAQVYWPEGTEPFSDGKAVETLLTQDNDKYSVKIGAFNNSDYPVESIDFVIHYSDDTWSSPDMKIVLSTSDTQDNTYESNEKSDILENDKFDISNKDVYEQDFTISEIEEPDNSDLTTNIDSSDKNNAFKSDSFVNDSNFIAEPSQKSLPDSSGCMYGKTGNNSYFIIIILFLNMIIFILKKYVKN